MRQGEILGLQWKDINFEKKNLHVQRQSAMYSNGGFEFRPPKGKNGNRKIYLGDDAIDVLLKHQTSQKLGNASKQKWNEYDLVFPSIAGTPINPSNLRRSFRKLISFAGLRRISFHDLRHTGGTLMINNNTPITTVSKRLGHSKVSMTLNTYGHSSSKEQEKAVNDMTEVMKSKPASVAHRSYINTFLSLFSSDFPSKLAPLPGFEPGTPGYRRLLSNASIQCFLDPNRPN
jgi:integrase